jgi:tight adherence protein C
MFGNLSIVLITVLVFGAVTIAVFVLGQMASVQFLIRRRVAVQAQPVAASPKSRSGLDALISTYFDEKRFGISGSVRANLRRELIRAGFFRADAINYYFFARFASVAILTITSYLVAQQFLYDFAWYLKFGFVSACILLAVLGPDAYIARRQRNLQADYRIAFPEMLDLMVVCVDAGLSLEAALDRISPEVTHQNYYLGTNLRLLGAETRAGRSFVDALSSFADRLGLDEAHSLAAILRQSVELGTDVGEALRVFSDEMRDRRLLRAEERANELPVKMVAPLALFIFPVILGLVLVPVILRLFLVVFKNM